MSATQYYWSVAPFLHLLLRGFFIDGLRAAKMAL
jgi:hypothetical protein